MLPAFIPAIFQLLSKEISFYTVTQQFSLLDCIKIRMFSLGASDLVFVGTRLIKKHNISLPSLFLPNFHSVFFFLSLTCAPIILMWLNYFFTWFWLKFGRLLEQQWCWVEKREEKKDKKIAKIQINYRIVEKKKIGGWGSQQFLESVKLYFSLLYPSFRSFHCYSFGFPE